MTLSYCWGNFDVPKLLLSNLTRFKDNIPYKHLPPTFRSAICITEWFKIDYLWIDALCILQDCAEDWTRESSRMRDIYKYTYATIAAAGAVDATVGCFFDRDPDLVRPIQVRAAFGAPLETDMIGTDDEVLDKLMGDTPLNRRAWCLQERCLSPRVLYFGEDQMHWECEELIASETFPNGMPQNYRQIASKTLVACIPHNDQFRILKTEGPDPLHCWHRLIEAYSRRELADPSDKCIAFAGIAEEFHALGYFQSEYIAGFWRKHLEYQLLWHVPWGQYKKRLAIYVAPSWSWLSVNDMVSMPNFGVRETELLLQILEVKADLASAYIFGPIKSGHIRARGKLIPTVWRRQTDGESLYSQFQLQSACGHQTRSCEHDWLLLDDKIIDEKNDTTLDNTDSNSPSQHDQNVVCTPILTDIRIYGLALVRVNDGEHVYRRVGMFRLQCAPDDEQDGEEATFQGTLAGRCVDERWEYQLDQLFTIV